MPRCVCVCVCVCVVVALEKKKKEKIESGKNKSRFFKGTRDKSRSGPSVIPLAAALIRSTIFLFYPALNVCALQYYVSWHMMDHFKIMNHIHLQRMHDEQLNGVY